MSDDTSDENRGRRGKKEPVDQSAAVTPTIRDEGLYSFLLGLFWSEPEPEHFPERVELNIVSGRQMRIDATLWTRPFAPIKANDEKRGAAKPNREQLAAMSNSLLEHMQRDSDAYGRSRVYALQAWSSRVSDKPYATFTKRVAPVGRFAGDVDGEEDGVLSTKLLLGLLQEEKREKRWMFEQVMNIMSGASERDADRIERLETITDGAAGKQMALVEAHERMMSEATRRELMIDSQRRSEARKDAFIQKGMGVAAVVLPKMLPGLAAVFGGAAAGVSAQSPGEPGEEVEALRQFLRTAEEGGQLTQQQMLDAFGDWDEETQRMVTPGILNVDQTKTILAVAQGAAPAAELDKLMPGGPLEITGAQLGQLMGVFGAQMLQLKKIFDLRTQKKRAA